MGKNNNDPFENLRKVQRMIEKINYPWEQYQKHLEFMQRVSMNGATTAAINSAMNLADAFKDQQKLIQSASFSMPHGVDYKAIYSAMESIAMSPIYKNTPKDTYKLSKTILRLISGLDLGSVTIFKEQSELTFSTFNEEQDEEGKASKLATIFSWSNIISIVIFVIQIIITSLIEAGNDTHHKEIVELLKESNELMQEEIDIKNIQIRDQEAVNSALIELLEQMESALQQENEESAEEHE